MKQAQKKKTTEKRGPVITLGKTNYLLFGLAVMVIIVGYYFLGIGPADSTESLTIAPIILIFGYVVLVPLAVFWRKSAKGSKVE